MIEEKRENRGEQPEEQVNIQEILFRYLIYWPWFVVSVIICILRTGKDGTGRFRFLVEQCRQ